MIHRLNCNYSQHLYLFTGTSRVAMIKYINKKYNAELEEEADEGKNMGLSYRVEHKDKADHFYIWVNPKLRGIERYGTIYHESFHIAFKILSMIGSWPSNSSEEAYAYLIDDIAEQINKKEL